MKLAEITQDLEGVEILADDILVYGKGETYIDALNNHNNNLEQVFKRLRIHNCKLNRDKLKLCKTSVKFFGHILTTEGLKADVSKVDAIRNMPKPKDRKGLLRFLGMVNYLSRYIKNLSSELHVLRQAALPHIE